MAAHSLSAGSRVGKSSPWNDCKLSQQPLMDQRDTLLTVAEPLGMLEARRKEARCFSYPLVPGDIQRMFLKGKPEQAPQLVGHIFSSYFDAVALCVALHIRSPRHWVCSGRHRTFRYSRIRMRCHEESFRLKFPAADFCRCRVDRDAGPGAEPDRRPDRLRDRPGRRSAARRNGHRNLPPNAGRKGRHHGPQRQLQVDLHAPGPVPGHLQAERLQHLHP